MCLFRYWTRIPTGQEWVVQAILGINHGALGVVPWNDPTPADIKTASSAFAKSLPNITPFLFNLQAAHSRGNYVVGGVDIATWSTGSQTLVLAANTNYVDQTVSWMDIGVNGLAATVVFQSGNVGSTSDRFTLGSVGAGAFVVQSSQPMVSSARKGKYIM